MQTYSSTVLRTSTLNRVSPSTVPQGYNRLKALRPSYLDLSSSSIVVSSNRVSPSTTPKSALTRTYRPTSDKIGLDNSDYPLLGKQKTIGVYQRDATGVYQRDATGAYQRDVIRVDESQRERKISELCKDLMLNKLKDNKKAQTIRYKDPLTSREAVQISTTYSKNQSTNYSKNQSKILKPKQYEPASTPTSSKTSKQTSYIGQPNQFLPNFGHNLKSRNHASFLLPKQSEDKLVQFCKDSIKQNMPKPEVFPKKRRQRAVSHNGLVCSQSSSLRTSYNYNQRPKTAMKGLGIQDFSLGECKGEGRFGKVFPAVHKRTGFLCGIKQIKKESVRFMLDQFVREIKISLFLDHPNIVKMYGFFSDRQNVYIMMEYMEQGSLFKTIKMKKQLSQEEACTRLKQVCQAVNYLHQNNILHRDIKPQNIVMTNDVCKLCDFGWAIYSKDRRNTYCGTLDYVCPQILEGDSYDSFIDIWAIGVLAFEMLTGKAPFYHISRKETMKSIMNCQFSFPSNVSLAAQSFITKALQKNPDQRFTIDYLLKDSLLSKASLLLC